ncbi:probable G-protein coupled receptor 148 [Boleophthalmus pectinirostris]|uniref:probable G-protein coupled receptor 148 n=1 Tax=Boleophthalmus pectinirostris TaxID=150288 RepID=UPI00242E42CC|nr:probable G-protein coupled receptor 148 [Boleophthalmus pectinirostris]
MDLGNMEPGLQISNITEEWAKSFRKLHMEFFVISTTVFTLATLIVNFILLACIFRTHALCQETRYLLVANTLISDVLFLIFHLTTQLCNSTGVVISWTVCELVTTVTATAYSSAILSVTLMVVDTYAAVRWPLKYREFLPPARTHRILLGMWLFATTYPLTLVILMVSDRKQDEEVKMCLVLILLWFMETKNTVGNHLYLLITAIVCAILILYCYIRLYMVTKTQGIWQSRFSRARGTLLVHGILLMLYFTPSFVFSVELILFHRKDINHDVQVWISTVNMSVFMLLPRACAPYLYGLRYREIRETLIQLLFHPRCRPQITFS